MDFFSQALTAALAALVPLEPEVADPLWRSLRVAGWATLVASLTGVPLGGFIALGRFRGRRVLISVFSTLMAVPTVVVGLVLYGLYTRRGPLGDLELLYTEGALITAEIVLSFPVVTRLTIAAVGAVDERIRQTTLTLGANLWQALSLTMREATAGIAVAVITGYGRAVSEVGAAMMVGGNIRGSTRTLTTAIALETSRGEFALGLALGGVLMSVFLLLNLFVLRLQDTRA